ncbi:MAG: hypothetical protein GY859_32160 [Desulfobacterales bacterium]|nr:hypothetical protein [Desulfobacterales bacterium]
MFTRIIIVASIIAFSSLACAAGAVTAAGEFFVFDWERQTYRLPCIGLGDNREHRGIEQVIIAVHGVGYNPGSYFKNAKALARSVNQEEVTLVLAPHIIKNSKLEEKTVDYITWEVSPFWGSSKGLINGEALRISAYDILDILLETLIDGERFPNLERIFLIGHSAGGQLVHRYALSSRKSWALERGGVSLVYIVMNPSSYVYLNGERPKGAAAVFETPDEYDLENARKYNHYGRGLEKLYAYHRSHTNADEMKRLYGKKSVLYLLGEKDNFDNGNLDASPATMLQGPNRLFRGVAYYNHLKNVYGDQITRTHALHIVKGVGHSSKRMMRSSILKEILME